MKEIAEQTASHGSGSKLPSCAPLMVLCAFLLEWGWACLIPIALSSSGCSMPATAKPSAPASCCGFDSSIALVSAIVTEVDYDGTPSATLQVQAVFCGPTDVTNQTVRIPLRSTQSDTSGFVVGQHALMHLKWDADDNLSNSSLSSVMPYWERARHPALSAVLKFPVRDIDYEKDAFVRMEGFCEAVRTISSTEGEPERLKSLHDLMQSKSVPVSAWATHELLNDDLPIPDSVDFESHDSLTTGQIIANDEAKCRDDAGWHNSPARVSLLTAPTRSSRFADVLIMREYLMATFRHDLFVNGDQPLKPNREIVERIVVFLLGHRESDAAIRNSARELLMHAGSAFDDWGWVSQVKLNACALAATPLRQLDLLNFWEASTGNHPYAIDQLQDLHKMRLHPDVAARVEQLLTERSQ